MDQKDIIKVLDTLKSEAKPRKFVESIDIAINFKDLNLKDPSNRFRLEIVLPHAPHKDVSICVIADGQQAHEAKDEPNVTVLNPNELDVLATDKKRARNLAKTHDFFIASGPAMVKAVKVLRRFLDPRGKMPAPIPPTAPIKPILEKYRRTARIRVRKSPTVHARIGTRDMDSSELASNILAVINAVEQKLERGSQNIKSVYVKATMSKAYRIL